MPPRLTNYLLRPPRHILSPLHKALHFPCSFARHASAMATAVNTTERLTKLRHLMKQRDVSVYSMLSEVFEHPQPLLWWALYFSAPVY